MKCQKYVELMSDYIDSEIPEEERALWEKHFEDCPPCADFFSSFKTSLELVEYMKSEPCPKEVTERLHRLLADKAAEKTGQG